MEAGLQEGDQIVAIDDTPVWRWEDMRRMIEKSPGKPVKIVVDRDGSSLAFTVTPKLAEQKSVLGEHIGRIGVAPSGRTAKLGFFPALYEGARFTVELTEMIWTTLVNLVKGKLSAKALSGPIMIAQASGESLKAGPLNYLVLMAFISINLAIINLLPVPILDGGHLMFFLIEAVTRRPVTGKVREVAVQLGLLFIVFLMCLVFYNDISRIITKGWDLAP
jgi:regulator of sigma E protease